MPRTKRRFADDDPSSPENNVYSSQSPMVIGYGRGKQLSSMMLSRGGGKQLQFPRDQTSDTSSDEDKSDEEEHHGSPPPQSSRGGGKAFRPLNDRLDSDEEEDQEPHLPAQPPSYPGGGKRFMGGKSFPHLHPMGVSSGNEDDDNDNEEEESNHVLPSPTRGPGKFLRPPMMNATNEEDSSDDGMDTGSDEDSDDDEEETKVGDTETDKNVILPPPLPPPLPPMPPPTSISTSNSRRTHEENISESESSPNTSRNTNMTPLKEEKDDSEPKNDTKLAEEGEIAEDRPALTIDADTERDRNSPSSNQLSSSSDEHEFDMETLDEQELVKDEEDQQYLDSLPEIERESILATRFEALKAEADMKRVLRENRRNEKNRKKKKRELERETTLRTGSRGAPTKNRIHSKSPNTGRGYTNIAKTQAGLSTKKDADAEENADALGTCQEAETPISLSLFREARTKNLKGVKGRKALALAKAREDWKGTLEDSDLDYGDDNEDENSDEDYEQPWMVKPKSSSSKQVSSAWKYSNSQSILGDEGNNSSYTESDVKPTVIRNGSTGRWNSIEADVHDYAYVSLPRRRLAKWCNEPYFEQAVLSFYVRLAIGKHEDTQKPYYKLCKIVKVEERAKHYKFPTVANEKLITTNKVLGLLLGNSKKYFKMVMVSDSPPTEEDVEDYLHVMKMNQIPLLSKNDSLKMKRDQDNLVNNYTYTNEDIEQAIEANKHRDFTIGNIGPVKRRVEIALHVSEEMLTDQKKQVLELKEDLLDTNNKYDVMRLEDELKLAEEAVVNAEADLEKKREEQRRVLEAETSRKNRMKSRRQAKAKNWSKVNERVKLENERAYLEAYKVEMEARKQTNTPKSFNPYARRKVKPKILWEVGQGQQEAGEIKQEHGRLLRQEQLNLGNTLIQSKGDNVEHGRKKLIIQNIGYKPKDINQIQELIIDEEHLVRNSGIVYGAFGRNPQNRVRKGISLQEYQEQKAAGYL